MKLEVKNLSFSYSKKEILKDINISVQSGDVLAILGPNGAGKTTLLKCMLSLNKLNNGDVLIDGKSTFEMTNNELWGRIAYVPQAREVNSNFLVEDMIMMGRSLHISFFNLPKEEDIKIVNDIMKDLNIEFLKGKSCNQISGGELQMVLVARALVSNPSILVLDEPETNLDSNNQLRILEVIKECSNKGIICIFNTHYPEHALTTSNKALILNYDNSYFTGNTFDVITEKNLETSFSVKSKIIKTEEDGKTFYSIINLERTNSKM